MRVLLVEDHGQLAGPIARELESEHGHQVVWARDPLDAAELLRTHEFDVAVVDLLYENLTHEFDAKRRSRAVSLTGSSRLLITGLFAVQAFRAARPSGGVVLWTSDEANRRLHLLFAYENLGVRAFCSKSSGTGKADLLHETICAADRDLSKVDPVFNAYLPVAGDCSVGDTLLGEDCQRAIWRAIALGCHTREEIASVTGYARRTIGNTTHLMLQDLMLVDPGLTPGQRPINELISFASRNWEFFLDESVKEIYG